MLFVQWDTHLRLLSLLGDANQHWPWKSSLCEAHEVHNKITSVDTVILKWRFTPSVSGLKLRGDAPSLAYKGLQVPQALPLQQRKWSLVLVCSPTAIIILAVPCSAHDFLPCPVSNVWIYCGVNQGKTDWYPKSPAAEKRDFLEWQCCLLPVASSPDQRNAITNQLLYRTLCTFNIQTQNGLNTLQKAPPSWKKPWSVQTLLNQLWHRTVSFPLYNSLLSAHTEIVS